MRTIQMLSLRMQPGPQPISAPSDAKVLGVRLAGDTPTLVIAAGPTPIAKTFVQRVGDGDFVPEHSKFLGLTQEHAGAPVWAWYRVHVG